MTIPTVIFNSATALRGTLRNDARVLGKLYSNCQGDLFQSGIMGAVVSESVPAEMLAKVADAMAHVLAAADSMDQFIDGYVVPNQ